MDVGPDRRVTLFSLPPADQSGDQIRHGQETQYEARQKRHKPRMRLLEGAEAQVETAVANDSGDPHPDQIVDEKGFLQRPTFQEDVRVFNTLH